MASCFLTASGRLQERNSCRPMTGLYTRNIHVFAKSGRKKQCARFLHDLVEGTPRHVCRINMKQNLANNLGPTLKLLEGNNVSNSFLHTKVLISTPILRDRP